MLSHACRPSRRWSYAIVCEQVRAWTSCRACCRLQERREHSWSTLASPSPASRPQPRAALRSPRDDWWVFDNPFRRSIWKVSPESSSAFFFSSKSKNYKFVVFFGFFHFDLAENICVPKRSWCLLIMASSSHFESSAKQLTGSTNLPRDIHSLTGQQPAAQRNVRQLASICDLFRDWFVKCL